MKKMEDNEKWEVEDQVETMIRYWMGDVGIYKITDKRLRVKRGDRWIQIKKKNNIKKMKKVR